MSFERCLLFLLLFFSYAYVYQGEGYNQNARLDLLHALVFQRSFTIDAYHTNTGDKAFHNGHYYSAQAPGTAFLALPAFTSAVILLNLLRIPVGTALGWQISSWITSIGSVAFLAALGGVALFSLLTSFVEKRVALLATLAVFLGSAPLPYATMLFSHAGVVGLLSLALFAALGCRSTILVGIACGMAVASEYTAAPAALGVLLLALSRNLRKTISLALATALPLLLVPLTSFLSFGSPFVTAYTYTTFPIPEGGMFGVPTLQAVAHILISPARGLFFWSPFFLLALPGYLFVWKRSRVLLLVSILVPLLQIILNAAFYIPGGGWALGPRYLAPMLPFLAIPASLGFRSFPAIGSALAFLSILLTGGATLISAQTPDSFHHPLVEYYFPALLEGRFAWNLGSLLGLPGAWSVFPLIAVLLLLSSILWCRLRPSPA